MIVSLTDAKNYLRVDYSDDDGLINSLILSAEKLCLDTLRITTTSYTVTDLMKTSILFAVGYLYDHRADANMEELSKMMRYLLATERNPAF